VPTTKATREKKTEPLKLPKMTNPAPSTSSPKSGGTHAESQSVQEQAGSVWKKRNNLFLFEKGFFTLKKSEYK
jgi:hypothetical protein